MLQSDLGLMFELDATFGLRELRAKIVAEAGIKYTKNDVEEEQPLRLSICAHYCFGTKAVEITRKFLDSGPLAQRLSRYIAFDNVNELSPRLIREFVTLFCGAMTLGCSFSVEVENVANKLISLANNYPPELQMLLPHTLCEPRARSQLAQALQTYQPGVPYDFGTNSYFERQVGPTSTTRLRDICNKKLVQWAVPGLKSGASVLRPSAIDGVDGDAVWPYGLCGGCGRDTTVEGGALHVCGGCKDRKYCSRKCQKAHRKAHKYICERNLQDFLGSIPLDFGRDLGVDVKVFLGKEVTYGEDGYPVLPEASATTK